MLTADFDAGGSDLVQIISDNRCGVCVRSEIAVPRQPLPLFVPYRLRLAYGAWVEPDGSTVLFSRDYAHLWRLREGRSPVQVPATDWIKHVGQTWCWGDGSAPGTTSVGCAKRKTA
ncbi:MAG TPA: hypothetical protein VMU69_18655 [Bradyrhizobium sp.]|nr:hypothetical protein [Bradyrhizobium sp.]